MNPPRGKRLRERARRMAQARAFFEVRGFLEVETPLLVPSPGLDLHLDAFRVESHFLSTSPEYQMKRLLAEGYDKIVQFAKAFRRNERGIHHNPEFSILEWYRADASFEEVMRDTEELVATLTDEAVHLGDRRVDTKPPFERMTVAEAFERFAETPRPTMLALAAENEDEYFRRLVDKVEPTLAKFERPVFLTDYPASQASLARRRPGDPHVAERFELYLAGVELCNGFGELTDPVEQRARFEHDCAERERRGLPVYPIDQRFLEALERGLPPCAGNALGLDRLIALSCGTTDIQNVMAFTFEEL